MILHVWANGGHKKENERISPVYVVRCPEPNSRTGDEHRHGTAVRESDEQDEKDVRIAIPEAELRSPEMLQQLLLCRHIFEGSVATGTIACAR